MTTIATQQARQRFKALPPVVQDAIFSVHTAEIIRRIGEQNHLPLEKISALAEAAGMVLLGFIHPEELKVEVQERLGADAKLAATLAESVVSRIFASIKDELDKIYAPLVEEVPGAPPKIIAEIKQPQTPPPAPTGRAVPSPVSPFREPEIFGEKPIILHEEAESEPGKPSAGFKLETPPPKFDETGEKFTPPMRPARLEIGIKKDEAPKTVNYSDLKTPIMSPERELPAAPPKPSPPAGGPPPYFRPSPPPQPAKEVNIRADEIKITIEKPKEEPRKSPLAQTPPAPPPPVSPIPIQKKRRGFWAWLKSLFSRRPKKEIVFAPKVISEEELKREALTIKASPPPGGAQPYGSRPSEPPKVPSAPTPQPPPPTGGPQPIQRPARGPSVFEEVVDLSTFTKTQKPFPPLDDSNTIDLKNNHNAKQ